VLIASAFPGVLWLLVVAAALLRRWTAVRMLAAAAGLAAIAHCLLLSQALQTFVPGTAPDDNTLVRTAGAGVLWSLLVLAAPGDLLDGTVARRSRNAVLPSLLLAAGILTANLDPFSGPGRTEAALSGVCLPLCLLPLAFLGLGRLLPAATGLAVLPWALTLAATSYRFLSWQDDELGDLGVLVSYALGVVLATLVTAAAVRFLKPARRAPGALGTQ
jgi:hypothetical protein